MTFWEAVNVLGQGLVLAVGLQLIGWTKFRARVAHEEWLKGDGPHNEALLAELARAAAEARSNMVAASAGMQAAADQIRREVR